MKRCKVLIASVLMLCLIFSMQVFAADSEYGADVQISANGADLQNVSAGDLVQFQISMKNTSAQILGGGSLRLVVNATDSLGNRVGNVSFPVEGNSDLGDRNNVQSPGIASAVVREFSPGETINAVSTVIATDDMLGEQITVSAKLVEDSGEKADVSLAAQISFSVAERVAEEISIKAEATPDIDINQLMKGQPFSVKLKVTNPGSEGIPNVRVDSAYGDAELTETNPEPLGTIIPQDDVLIQEDGSGYIPFLEAGKSVEVTVNCVIPENYAKDTVYMFFAGAVTEAEEPESEIVAMDIVTLIGKIPAVTPNPESENPKTEPEKVKPTPKVENAVPKTKPAAAAASRSPKTGDTSPVAAMVVLIACAGAVSVYILKKRTGSIDFK